MSEDQNTPLWKQLLGAATGATVALLLYWGFTVVSPNLPTLTAYLLSDFEEKIENMPVHPHSPRTVREEAITWREELGDRARAATAKLQEGKDYFQGGQSFSSLSSVTAPVPSVTKEKEEVPQKKSASSKKHDSSRSKKRGEKKDTDDKQKEEKLPDTGVPLWAIGGVAFCLAMSVRYRKELLGCRVS